MMKRRLLGLIMLVTLIMANSLTVLGAEGQDLGSWETISSMPVAIYDSGAVEVNGKIYNIGGVTTTGLKTTVDEYDPLNNTWQSKTSIPTSRHSLGVVEANGKIYAIGGYAGDNKYAIVEEYDPSTDTWATKTSMPEALRYFGIAESQGKIYVIGGSNSQGNYISTVQEYDPVTDTWTTKASMPEARAHCQAVEFNGKIYVISGYVNGHPSTTVEEYDPQTNTWTSKSDLLNPRYYFGATEVNEKIYVIGGKGATGETLSTVEEYDIIKDTWTIKASMPTARRSLGIVEYDNKIYALGGNYGLDIVEVFTPPTTEKVVSPTNLIATSSSNNITLNWDAVADADSYTILRSTTSGTIDTVIATNITDTTYTDTNVTPGITYYYVVRAVKSGVESADSNIASAMVENNVATLQIKLSTTDIYEYKMTMSDVTNFINWYTDRSNNTGLPFYIFPDSTNIEPYTKINEYIIHDKIVWFKVKEYLK